MREIFLADYGILPNHAGDLAGKLSALLSSLRAEQGLMLRFAQGEYHFYAQTAPVRRVLLAGERATDKAVGIDLSDFRGLTLDGAQSLFVFHGALLPLYAKGAQHLTLQNFSIDLARPLCADGRVMAIGRGAVELDLDPTRFAWRVEEHTLLLAEDGREAPVRHWLEMKADGTPCRGAHSSRRPSAWQQSCAALRVTAFSPRRVQLQLPPKAPLAEDCRCGDAVLLCTRPSSEPAVALCDSAQVCVRGVCVHHAAGDALLAQGCADVALEQVSVCRNPKNVRLITALGDAVRFVSCAGVLRVQSCLFEHQLGSAVRVYGVYGTIVRKTSLNTLRLAPRGPSGQGVYLGRAGDRVAFLDAATLRPKFTTYLEAIEPAGQGEFSVLLREALPLDLAPGDLAENLTQTPELFVDDCVFCKNCGAGVRAACAQLTVSGCRFETAQAAVALEGDACTEYESGALAQAELRGSTFAHCAYVRAWSNAPVQVTPQVALAPQAYYHQTLRLCDNHCLLEDGRLLYARSIAAVRLHNNRITKGAEASASGEKTYDLENVGWFERTYACR